VWNGANWAATTIGAASITDLAVTFAKLSGWTWASFGTVGNFNAGGDRNYRQFTNGSTAYDQHTGSSWITAAGTSTFQFPSVGKYLFCLFMGIPHQTGSDYFGVMSTSPGGAFTGLPVKGTNSAGIDAFSGIYSGASTVCILDIASASQAYTMGGYASAGGQVRFDVTAIRLPV